MLEVRIDHAASVLIEDALLEQRIGKPHQHAALDLAFDLQRIDRPTAILDRDHALHPHDAGLGIDRHLGELNTAEILMRERGICHGRRNPP